MATVRKRPVKKKVSKKKSSKKLVTREDNLPKVEDKKKLEYLTSEDLLSLETLSREVENSRLLMSIEEQNLANMKLRLELLAASIEKQKGVVSQKAAQYESKKDKYVGVKKNMFPRYGLTEKDALSYNSTTGEIIRD